MSTISSLFNQRCAELGVAMPGCGVAARDLLVELQTQGMAPRRDEHHGLKIPNRNMGAVVRNGLARFDLEQRSYLITEKGTQWLVDLAAHGLLGKEAA